MFTRLRIQNFKAWKDTGTIRLAPLTVVFGTNSSGKTSFHQLLLMLKQTAQLSDRRRVLHFGGGHSLVDLGVWPEMVFNHDPNATLKFELEWKHQLEKVAEEFEPFSRRTLSPLLSFEAAIGQAIEPPGRIEVKQFAYRLTPAEPSSALGVAVIGMRRNVREEGYKLWANPPIFPRTAHDAMHFPAPIHFYRFPDEVELWAEPTANLERLVYDLVQQLNRLKYLGPLRTKPARIYSWSGEAPETVGAAGEDTVAALLVGQDRFVELRGEPARPLMEVIAQFLLDMKLLASFEARVVAERRKEYEVLVRTPGNPRQVSLADVGFGVSQVLPVLVQCFYTDPGSTLIFEQPELHLHPRAQSELGDLFIEALHAEEDGKPRDIQFLIESHSEHLLRRIQRRIAEGRLKREDAALYFCSPGPEGSRIEELKLDENGNITNWPENFFGDEMGDLVAMTEAAMKRQMEQERE